MPVDSHIRINTTLVRSDREAIDEKSLKCTWTHPNNPFQMAVFKMKKNSSVIFYLKVFG